MEKQLTEQDSLKLINEMISQARNNFQKGAGNSFIFAGYSVAITAIINLILIHTLNNPNDSYWIWLLMIPMQIGFKFIDRKRNKEVLVKTHIDKVIKSIWGGFGYSIIVIIASIFGTAYALNISNIGIVITPIILTMLGLAQYATATACSFRLYHYGAIIFWLGAILSVATYFTGRSDLQFIVLALCMVAGFVIPGHIANKKAKQYV